VSFEFVAHGDDMLLARQSHQVAVEDEYHAATPAIGETPLLTIVVQQDDGGRDIARIHKHHSLLCPSAA
jgi:hypothetical protein